MLHFLFDRTSQSPLPSVEESWPTIGRICSILVFQIPEPIGVSPSGSGFVCLDFETCCPGPEGSGEAYCCRPGNCEICCQGSGDDPCDGFTGCLDITHTLIEGDSCDEDFPCACMSDSCSGGSCDP